MAKTQPTWFKTKAWRTSVGNHCKSLNFFHNCNTSCLCVFMKHFPVRENANLVIKQSFTVASIDFMVLF